MFPEDQFLKGNFEKETYMCVVNEKASRFLWSHWVMVYQEKKKIYLIDSLGRNIIHYDFKFKGPFYQVSRRLQCLDSKLCGTYLVFFGCKLERGLDLDSIMITLHGIVDWRMSSSTIIKEKLQTVKTKQEDSVQ